MSLELCQRFLTFVIFNLLGGVLTLPGIAALLTNLFSDKMTNGLVNLGQTFAMLKPGAT